MRPKKYIGLEMKMVELGENNITLAEAIGINPSSLYNKRTGQTEFTIKNARAIKDRLNLSNEELNDIFFS